MRGLCLAPADLASSDPVDNDDRARINFPGFAVCLTDDNAPHIDCFETRQGRRGLGGWTLISV